ncbi:AzlC family ABC transporter permease [Microbacteriaceae bacterium 4G12]
MQQWRQGVMDAIPIGLSFLLFGSIFGMMAMQTGLTAWQSVAMSMMVFAGAAQFACLPMLAEHASYWTIILATFLINSRHLLMGLSISPYYKTFSKRFVNFAGFFLLDEQYALTLHRFRHHKPNQSYIIGLSLTFYITWCVGTWLGTVAGGWIPNPEALGLGFSFTAMFLALVYYQFTSLLRVVTFFVCGLVATMLVFVLPNGLHILVAGIVSFAIGYALPAKEQETETEQQEAAI